MVHLAILCEPEVFQRQSDPTDPETELTAGPGAGDTSQEASGFYGTDTEDRDRGDEDRERRGGDDWDRDAAEDRQRREGQDQAGERTDGHGVHFLDNLEVNHTTPDLDALIGSYTLHIRHFYSS